MKTSTRLRRLAVCFCVLLTSACTVEHLIADEEPTPQQIADKSMRILRRCCSRCHKGQSSFFNAASVKSMTASYLDPGSVENSYILDVVKSGMMPPKNRPQLPRPTPEEFETLQTWVEGGCVEPTVNRRPTFDLEAELRSIYSHLTKARPSDLPNLRYFSLRNLQNDATVDEFQLMMTRAALSKTVNSLSWETDLHLPQATDRDGNLIPATVDDKPNPQFQNATVYAVDIDKLGWNRQHWNAILSAYPYAVSYEGRTENENLHELSQRIQNVRGSREPVVVRADWFVSVATRPPVYHKLLYDLHIPDVRRRASDSTDPANPQRMTDLDLESFLGVRVANNILSGKAKRSGFTESGVSGQNRLIERHSMARGGAYWKSYDFKDSNRRSILTEFPLGPVFDDNPFNALAFTHDGGEIIFNLPNGLQAYLLVDGAGNRIDAGPIEVVGDSLKTSGNEQIFTGVSCMACHRSGMINSPQDEVRRFSSLAGPQRRLLQNLYPESDALNDLISDDSEIFMRSLRQVMTDFVDVGSLEDLPEPVGEVSRRYFLEPMKIETVAAELDLNPGEFEAGLKANRSLQQLGLRVLLHEGGSIKRAAWQTGEGRNTTALTLMKEVAREFGFSPRQ